MALSRDDVRKHLEDLGYFNVSDELLDVFAKGNVTLSIVTNCLVPHVLWKF